MFSPSSLLVKLLIHKGSSFPLRSYIRIIHGIKLQYPHAAPARRGKAFLLIGPVFLYVVTATTSCIFISIPESNIILVSAIDSIDQKGISSESVMMLKKFSSTPI